MTPSAEERSLLARERLGVGRESPVPDLLRLVEDEDTLRVFILPIPESDTDRDSQSVAGAIKVSDGSPFVLLNVASHPVRIRFTLAHEYGHFILGHGSQMDVRIKLSDRKPIEAAANSFAAGLLMPRPGVHAWLDRNQNGRINLETVVRLAYYFNVSVPAAHFRLVSMGKLKPSSRVASEIEEQMYLELARMLGLTRGEDSIAAAHRRGSYVPAEMRARISRLLEKGLISKKAAAARLHLPSIDDELALERALTELSVVGDEIEE